MDVRDLLARLLESLLRLVRPDAETASPPPFPAGTAVSAPRPAPPVRPHTAVLRGEDTALVRPYLLAHERRQTRWPELRLAVHGVDLLPAPGRAGVPA
ncbi:hypothetical protein [Streptomyces wuyuanensis]|uniref:hypothetical protein n=1 Tax=Streptomyces wuyuanensis TaxID=1196353 RepID=UPI000B87C797|nr:hypothetical protein [Streptomyces wuyuanensis]